MSDDGRKVSMMPDSKSFENFGIGGELSFSNQDILFGGGSNTCSYDKVAISSYPINCKIIMKRDN